MMERLTVTEGLWAMYADNGNTGIGLRNHPFDNSPKIEPSTAYLSMQKIYCDRRVVHPNSGVVSYRVQGTEGWVFDKRISDNGESYMLLPESSVKTGLFVYEVLSALNIRSKPSTSDESRTSLSTNEKELVSCDTIRQSPFGNGGGPFVRLTDGSGWVFLHKGTISGPILQEIRVEEGSWMFKVLNSPVGIGLRRQPIDNKMYYDRVFQPEEIVTCDRKVRASTGVNFYRVKGIDGWVFDRRGDSPMMQLVQHRSELENDNSLISTKSWSIDYIRGVASATSLKEVMFNPESRVISFKGEESEARINIYYTTRTVGTSMDHPIQGKTQLFRRNCSDEELVSIMKDPRTHTGKGYYRKRGRYGNSIVYTQHGEGIVIEGEEELRNSLLEIDEQISKLQQKKKGVQNSLESYDDKRTKLASEVESKRLQRVKEEEARMEAKRQEELARTEARIREEQAREEARRREEQAREEERRRLELTCGTCGRLFVNRRAKSQHCNALRHRW